MSRKPNRLGTLQRCKLPIGDQYAPFWTLDFFASENTFLDARQALIKSGKLDEVVEIPSDYNPGGTEEAVSIERKGSQQNKNRQDGLNLFNLEAYKQSLTVTYEGPVAEFELALSPPYDDALKIIEQPLFTFSAVVVAEWGYIDQMGKTRSDGKHVFLAHKPQLSFSDTEVSLTFGGVDIMSSSIGYVNKRDWSRTEFPSDADILKKLAKESGIKLDVRVPERSRAASTKQAVGKEQLELHSLFKKGEEPNPLQQDATDLAFFESIVKSNNCSYTPGPEGVVIIYDQDTYQKEEDISYNLLAYKQPLTEKDVCLTSFSPTVDERAFAPASAQGLAALQADPAKGTTKKTKQDAASDTKLAHGDGVIASGPQTQKKSTVTSAATVSPGKKTAKQGASFSGPAGDTKFVQKVRQRMIHAASLAGIKASATMLGVVGMTPYCLVDVQGVGTRLSGVYRVLKVTHSLGSGGYDTEVELYKDTISKLQTPDTKKPNGPKNDEAKKRKQRCFETPVKDETNER